MLCSVTATSLSSRGRAGKWHNSYGAIWRYVDALDELGCGGSLAASHSRFSPAPDPNELVVDLAGDSLGFVDQPPGAGGVAVGV